VRPFTATASPFTAAASPFTAAARPFTAAVRPLTVERFIGAPSVKAGRQPPMNCDDERALAAYHDVASHYGDFSVMRKP
jgi:hypothetical protein